MGYTNTQQKYLAAGRCTKCGKARLGEAAAKTQCAACLLKKRTREQAKRNARKAAKLCIVCGKLRERRTSTMTRCGLCAEKQRKASAAYQQRQRNKAAGYTEGDGKNAKRLPVGRGGNGKHEGGAYKFPLVLDRDSRDAIQVIRKRYRDAEWKAGRVPQTHQLSRLVREVILKYEPSRAVVKPRKHRLRVADTANLSLDGRTEAILRRQAALSFNGNLSATLRAMLIECQGFRRAFTGRG